MSSLNQAIAYGSAEGGQNVVEKWQTGVLCGNSGGLVVHPWYLLWRICVAERKFCFIVPLAQAEQFGNTQ